ncbi:uncharacterized protein PG986_002570 [Apiospora aurea]|uniref:Uncharacterized protein n=1 Tax=Apiospora aurea TaxID=335848 RepID=A0ABR1QP73_9PEZI
MSTADLGGGGMLDRLPDELLWDIADLSRVKDLGRLTRTSKRMHQRLNPYLYKVGMQRDGRPLQYACRNDGRDDIISRVLLYHKPQQHAGILAHRFRYGYNCQAQNTTPLALAIRYYNLPVVRMLVGQGADGHQPSILADVLARPIFDLDDGVQIRFELAELLVKAGADVNKVTGSSTPLLLAVEHRCESRVINLLLKSGAELKGPYSPLHMFLETCENFTDDRYESAKLLVKAAAKNPDAAQDHYSMLLCLRPHEDERWIKLVAWLLEAVHPRWTQNGESYSVYFLRNHLEWLPSFDFSYRYASTPEKSVRYDRVRQVTVRILELLFAKAGSTVNDSSPHGTPTPLMIAAGLPCEFDGLFYDVLRMGANGRVRVDGATAFHYMFEHPCHALKERIAPLVAINCPINAKDRDGNTLLHKAALRGMVPESWLPELTKYKFDFMAKNRASQTFIDILCYKPATSFYPAWYDRRLADSLQQQIEELKTATSNNRKRPKDRGRGPSNNRK